MTESNSPSKDKIIADFEMMRSFELSAHDLYTRIATELPGGPEKIRAAFSSLATDEKRHADLVQEILDIVSDAL
jgi:rubrerythrin